MEKPFEARIGNVAKLHPEAPKREIVLSRLYFHAFKAMNESQNRRLSAWGLNTTSWIALMLIYSTPGNTIHPGELSEAMVSSKTNVTRLSDELVKKGWVDRSQSTDDRRKIQLSLTASGREIVEKILPQQMEFHRTLWGGFSKEELAVVESVLRKISSIWAEE